MNNQMSSRPRASRPTGERSSKSCRSSSGDSDVPLLVTPKNHIPLGKPVIDENGNMALEIKKKGTIEIVPLFHLLELITKGFRPLS